MAPVPDHNNAFSLLPDLVNLLVVNGRVIVAEPFFQGFKSEFESRLATIGYNDGTSIQFIDDWILYHRNVGEIHCGTNTKRNPLSTEWWTQEID